MLAEDLERIFEAFVQVDNSATREVGTGLGLVIVKKFVEEHGGSMFLAPQLGTLFRCSFPASRRTKATHGEL